MNPSLNHIPNSQTPNPLIIPNNPITATSTSLIHVFIPIPSANHQLDITCCPFKTPLVHVTVDGGTRNHAIASDDMHLMMLLVSAFPSWPAR